MIQFICAYVGTYISALKLHFFENAVKLVNFHELCRNAYSFGKNIWPISYNVYIYCLHWKCFVTLSLAAFLDDDF